MGSEYNKQQWNTWSSHQKDIETYDTSTNVVCFTYKFVSTQTKDRVKKKSCTRNKPRNLNLENVADEKWRVVVKGGRRKG